MSEFNIDNSK